MRQRMILFRKVVYESLLAAGSAKSKLLPTSGLRQPPNPIAYRLHLVLGPEPSDLEELLFPVSVPLLSHSFFLVQQPNS